MAAPDIASFLGGPSGGAAPNPLDQAMGTKPSYGDKEPDPNDPNEASEDEVDPKFKSTAAELFPDWPDEDFGKLQKLIDMRVNGAGMGA